MLEAKGDYRMKNNRNQRIALFECDWSMYTFIKDFIVKLADVGYSVDVFFRDWQVGRQCTDTNEFKLYGNVRFFDFTTPPTRAQVFRRRYKRLLNRAAILLSLPRDDNPDDIIDHSLLNKARGIIGTTQYYCFIGIEKKGLIWAGILSDIYRCPLIYHSLELYTNDHPGIDRFYHLLNAEKKYHQRAVATIVQDDLRATVLLKSNGIERTDVLCYPVCVKGTAIKGKSKYLQNKFNIGDDRKILLYFGNLEESRCATQMVRMARNLDEGVILVVHGWGRQGYLDYLQLIADKKKVIFSWEFLPEDEIATMVSSSHIGIALYDTRNSNDRLVAFASSKIAYYAQCGIPFISFDTESLRELVGSYRCAELITSVDETPEKVREILGHYDLYSRQCHEAYQRFYNLDCNFPKLLDKLEPILDRAHKTLDEDQGTLVQGGR